MRRRLIAALAALSLMAAGACAALEQQPDRRVAITIDDVPYQGERCDPDRIRADTLALVAVLRPLNTHAVAFVNEGQICEAQRAVLTPWVLEQWLDAGMDLGNHTATHPDLNTMTVEAYLADVDAGAPLSRAALRARGRDLVWFRHPFLKTGATEAVRDGVARGLAERGYIAAPVTLDASDWLFAGLYRRAEARGDTELMRRIGEAFVDHFRASLEHDEALSRRLFGREPAQIYLMHANSLARDWYPAVDAVLRERGYRYVTLEEAMQDPVYARTDTYVGEGGWGWLGRWAQRDGVVGEPEPALPQWILDLQATGDE